VIDICRLQCSSTEKHLQMCESCAQHCSPWEWETSGYSLLNGTELQIEDLYWSPCPTELSSAPPRALIDPVAHWFRPLSRAEELLGSVQEHLRDQERASRALRLFPVRLVDLSTQAR
jgi:hypothetical protein